jgi:NAD(P)-dependent dehydrogenase (short-subunit alcohol dehydrogenase family)
MTSPRTWFITGASRGFGRIWAEAALGRGDRIAATGRDLASVTDLAAEYGDAVLPLALDVTRRGDVFAAVRRAAEHFGRLDIVITAAGYGLFGAIEEVSEAQARDNIETNVFGTLSAVQAAMPIFRAQGHGRFLLVSSLGGLVASPMFFQPTKWAVEAIGESLSQEAAEFGIHVTLIEPGAYATTFFTGPSARTATAHPAYDAARARRAESRAAIAFGDPRATAPAILKAADAEQPPLRLILGTESLPIIKRVYASRLAEWEAWAPVSRAAQGSAAQDRAAQGSAAQDRAAQDRGDPPAAG